MAKPTGAGKKLANKPGYFIDPESGISFLHLSPPKDKKFRKWARINHQPGGEINAVWHPVVRDECTKIDAEHAARAQAQHTQTTGSSAA